MQTGYCAEIAPVKRLQGGRNDAIQVGLDLCEFRPDAGQIQSYHDVM